MKIFLLLFLFLTVFQVQANDTLTRAQVYNFNVGDTFDYKIEDILYASADESFPISSHQWFNRVIVKNTNYYLSADSLVVVEQNCLISSPDSITVASYDTLSFDSASNYAIFGKPSYAQLHLCRVIIDTGFNQKITNTAWWSCGNLGLWAYNIYYAIGLGSTGTLIYTSDGSSSSEKYDTSLIYYSKSGETWGTPATIAVGFPNVTIQQSAITLFPSINDGQFKIKITNGVSSDYQLTVYDLPGREIHRAVLNKNITNIEIPHQSAGMYLWNVTSHGSVLQSGKMIVN